MTCKTRQMHQRQWQRLHPMRTGNDQSRPKQQRRLLERVVVHQARVLVQPVWHRLEEHRRRRHPALGRHEAVRQVAACIATQVLSTSNGVARDLRRRVLTQVTAQHS